MKTRTHFLNWLTLALLLTVNVLNMQAQGPFPSSATPDSVCLNSTESYGVNLTAGSTYAWSISDPTAGTIATGATPNLIAVTWTKTGNYTLQVIETNQYNCVGVPVSIDITVNPTAAIVNKTATMCSGETFTVSPINGTDQIPAGTTYSWSAPAVTGVTGMVSGSGATNISGTLTNTTNAPVNVVYTVTPTSGSCTGASFTVTVTVYPQVNTSPIFHN